MALNPIASAAPQNEPGRVRTARLSGSTASKLPLQPPLPGGGGRRRLPDRPLGRDRGREGDRDRDQGQPERIGKPESGKLVHRYSVNTVVNHWPRALHGFGINALRAAPV